MTNQLNSESSALIKSALKSQYKASLLMLENVIQICSDDLWTSQKYQNRTWQIAYHALFFTNLYLFQHLDQRKNWINHRKEYQNVGESEGKTPYTRSELIEFTRELIRNLDKRLDQIDLNASDSGFFWYTVNKLEHQLVNLKHLQHHLAQLQDRLRNDQNEGISWIRDGSGDRRQ
ncbi:MAG: hypothetical protein HKN76_20250 [Saprospiraceae bacterium]|nr:hypothetical protein [Saprospiraceae bacterium]